MKILALDPGLTTGVCILLTTEQRDDFEVDYVSEMSWDDRFRISKALIAGTWPQRMTPDPGWVAAARPPEVVVIEQFRLRQGKAYAQAGSTFPSIQVQAIIETFVWDYNHNVKYGFMGATRDEPIEIAYQEPIAMARVQILADHHHLIAGSEHMKDAYKHGRYYFETKVRQT